MYVLVCKASSGEKATLGHYSDCNSYKNNNGIVRRGLITSGMMEKRYRNLIGT